MTKRFIASTLLLFAFISTNAQQKFAGHLNVGFLMPMTDLTSSDYGQNIPNMGVDLGISYKFWPKARLRGTLMTGMMTGTNGQDYYELYLVEPAAHFDLSILELFNAKTKMKFYGSAGLAMTLYSSKKYSITNGILNGQSPTFADEKGLSPNGAGILSGLFEFPITKNMYLNAGYGMRATINDWLDVSDLGEGYDFYGVGSVGLTFKIGNSIPKGKIAVDKSKYDGLNQDLEKLKKDNAKLKTDQENIAILEMTNQEKDLKMAQMQTELDSLRNAMENAEVVDLNDKKNTDNSSMLRSDYGEPAYRIIVMSMPTEQMAQNWIDKSNLESEEMFIAYSEKVDSYRVVYKSFPTFEAAKKELQNVKMAINDAWIIQF